MTHDFNIVELVDTVLLFTFIDKAKKLFMCISLFVRELTVQKSQA